MEEKLPKGWEPLRLIDVLQALESGARPKGGLKDIKDGVPSIGGEHLDNEGYIIFNKMGFVPREFYDNLRRGRIQKGDVLLVKDGATTGKVALIRKGFPFSEASVNEHVFICRSNRDLMLPEYLFYHLFSSKGQNQIRKSIHGSAQGGIITDFANNYIINTPKLATQCQIVAILDKVEETRRLRAQADKLASQMVQSVFLEIFGNPLRNLKGWKNESLGSHISFMTSGSRGWAKFYSNSKNGAKFIRVQNLTGHRLNCKNLALISPPENAETKRTKIKPQDLLISITGTHGVGFAAVVPEDIGDAYVSQHVAIVRLQEDIDPVFAAAFIACPTGGQIQIRKQEYGQTKPGIGLHDIRSLNIFNPPIDLQRKFAKSIAKIEQITDQTTLSKQKIDGLFNAIMQKAFTGGLVA